MAATRSIESLEEQIAELTENRKVLEAAIKENRHDEDLRILLRDVEQTISMTKDVLLLKRQELAKKEIEEKNKEEKKEEPPTVPSLPENIMIHPVGHVCRAKWSHDNKWYDAVIEKVDSIQGTYQVLFTGYGNRDTVKPEHISPMLSSLQPKQDLTPLSIPDSLKISKEDSLEVKAAKKKKIHSIKSKNRFKEMDAMTNSKKNEWKNFMESASKKRRGVPVGRKESMFRSPDTVDGRVGVVGSGKGMTTYNTTRKVDPRRKKVELSLEQPKTKK